MVIGAGQCSIDNQQKHAAATRPSAAQNRVAQGGEIPDHTRVLMALTAVAAARRRCWYRPFLRRIALIMKMVSGGERIRVIKHCPDEIAHLTGQPSRWQSKCAVGKPANFLYLRQPHMNKSRLPENLPEKAKMFDGKAQVCAEAAQSHHLS